MTREAREKWFHNFALMIIGAGIIEFGSAIGTYRSNWLFGAAAVVVGAVQLWISDCRLIYRPRADDDKNGGAS